MMITWYLEIGSLSTGIVGITLNFKTFSFVSTQNLMVKQAFLNFKSLGMLAPIIF